MRGTRPRRPARQSWAWLCLALALAPGPAAGVEIVVATPATGCAASAGGGAGDGGVASCLLAASATEISVTWSLSEPQELNGYDLEVRWDAGELTLLGADPLFPEGGPALPFLLAPADPDASRVAALSLEAAPARALFRLRFALAAAPRDGNADVRWAAAGRGLSPETQSLDNPTGGGIDFWKPACGDGVDNDADGRRDFDAATGAGGPSFVAGTGDPGCESPAGEREDPQCQDGRDNDADGSVDFDGGISAAGAQGNQPDAECAGRPWRDDEGCGLGFELALLLPFAERARSRRAAASAS